ncbi:MAG: carboxylesterase family protein [Myxococcota bacterium]
MQNARTRSVALLVLAMILHCGDDASAPADGAIDGSMDGSGDASVGAPDAGIDAAERDDAVDAMAPDASMVVPFQDGTTVMTTEGEVTGDEEGELRVFRGIPFAAPPTGERRLRAPAPPEPRDAPLEADAFGAACAQPGGPSSEDCLFLNVWAHPSDTPRPVMVWIYGGGFITGDSALPIYNGANLAEVGDVVVVSINYRLGILGGLALPELQAEDPDGAAGNMALLDQIQALRWLQANLPAFGGDPNNVTIFGESAGAISACALLGAPAADALFHKAIMQSGNCASFPTLERGPLGTDGGAFATGERFAEALGCGDAEDRLACLRDLPTDAFLDALGIDALLTGLLTADLTSPVVDGVVLPELPFERLASGDAPDRPLLAGSNGNEGQLFTAADVVLTRGNFRELLREVLDEDTAAAVVDLYSLLEFPIAKDAYNAFIGEVLFNCNSYEAARAVGGHYYLLMTAPAALSTPYGPLHGADIFYVFDTFTSAALIPGPRDLFLRSDIQTAWTSFARTGVPIFDGGWPTLDEGDEYLRFGALRTTTETEYRGGRCESLRELGVLP